MSTKPPTKPRPDFPLTPCGNGQWRKKVNGKPYYFGSWRSDPRGEQALKNWVARRDSIHAGLDHLPTSPSPASDITIGKLVGDYLAIRAKNVTNRELAPDSYRDYRANLSDFAGKVGPQAKAAGLKPAHFAAYRATLESRGIGPHATKRIITNIKAAFNYAVKEEWIPSINFGQGFSAPNTDSEAVALYHLRRGRENRTEVILGRRDVRRLLYAAKDRPLWRAMVYLMLNAGMNPAELARLQWSDINFKSGRLRRRRQKTGIWQECYLWRRTRRAINALPRVSDYVFTRVNGAPLVDTELVLGSIGGQQTSHVRRSNRITQPFHDLAQLAGLKGVTPYTLRRTARTVAAHCEDDNAARRMMGQRLAGRDQTYIRQQFPLARLKRISRTIFLRLFGVRQQKPPKPDPEQHNSQDKGDSGYPPEQAA
jgi:integrase